MAYDLILRRQVRRDFSRASSPAAPCSTSTTERDGLKTVVVSVLGLVGLCAWSAVPRIRRSRERRWYRREFSDDPKTTQEIPVVPMREMVRERG